jgi:hypothetical protein
MPQQHPSFINSWISCCLQIHTQWSTVPHERLTAAQLNKKFATIMEIKSTLPITKEITILSHIHWVHTHPSHFLRYIQFKTKNSPTYDINIVCDDNLITPVPNIKFLGIYLQDSINWNCHIDYIMPKLSSACYIMRSIKPIMSINTLKTVYYSCFNAIITYGLPFWGNSPHSIKIFKTQKRIIRIMTGYNNRV